MTPGCRRPRAAAVALFFAVSVSGPWLSAASTAGLTIRAEAGLAGTVRPGRYMPVRVSLENAGADIAGELVVTAGTARTRHAISLPSPSRKRIELYMRAAGPDVERLRVAVVSGGREVGGVDVPIRVFTGEQDFVLCVSSPVASGFPSFDTFELHRTDGFNDDSCAATLNRAALPPSWRGYDAVDAVRWPPAGPPPQGVQRIALEEWKAMRAQQSLVAPVVRPREATSATRQSNALIATYALLAILAASLARVLSRRPATFYSAIVALIAFGSAAALAQGRVGAGSAVLVDDSTVVRAGGGTAGAFVSTRGTAVFPSFHTFELRPTSAGAFVAARAADPAFAEDGASLVSGAFGKGATVSFELEGFTGQRTLDVERADGMVRLSNVSGQALRECELPPGLSPRAIPVLAAGARVDVRGIPEGENAALRCTFDAPWPTLDSPGHRIEHRGTAVLIYDLRDTSPRTVRLTPDATGGGL